MLFRQIFDEKLAQYAYLIGCQATREAIIFDPERDIDQYIALAEREGMAIVAAADTHIHADYLSGLREFAERGVRVYASDEGGDDWKYEFLQGSSYDHVLLRDGDTFQVGNIRFTALHTPGHTPEHVSYLVTDLGGGASEPMGIISGDFVFVGDLGRPDLLESAAGVAGAMEPSAYRLYGSVQRFLGLDDYLQVWPAHGAGSACGKALGAVPESTVGYERRYNTAIRAAEGGPDAFVKAILDGQPEPPMYFARMKRDNRHGPPVLGALPSPQHIYAGDIPALLAEDRVVVLDTRLDRSAFLAHHLPGALYAPLNKSFNAAAGSVLDETQHIVLFAEEEHVEEAVRDLFRIGLDHIIGYLTPDSLGAYQEAGGDMETIEEIDITDLAARADCAPLHVLDVRGSVEFAEAHLPKAQNIAYTRLIPRRNEITTTLPIAVHCKSGARSAVAAALLARWGHNVIHVGGDFDAFVHAAP
ncbi:MAG: MBL fold metallo-hydrolase [Bacteroidetes bacterium CG12_big_fil_rev_8_21_14_0_65_60_17]|nr:MAG: MBL fold metallo-hydrolase [Bacteroidetes bacterium CG12_big_fil_rev_8_21_14_0_65_60_17]